MTAAFGGKTSMAGAIGAFFRLVIGGAALGAGIGWLASRVHFALDDHLVEITLTTVVAFGSFLAAEALHVSGVIAVVAAGLVVGNYGMPTSMSAGTRLAVASFWEYATFVVNSIVFLLIGIEVAYVNWWHKAGLVAGAVIAVLVGRAAIYPLSLLVNRLKGNIPIAWQHILFWGGLRGALSMALVLGLAPQFPHLLTPSTGPDDWTAAQAARADDYPHEAIGVPTTGRRGARARGGAARVGAAGGE
jgi:CPA1 family monovalent cation:H+ antiporter